jgi:hypothetical protein
MGPLLELIWLPATVSSGITQPVSRDTILIYEMWLKDIVDGIILESGRAKYDDAIVLLKILCYAFIRIY